MIGNKLRTIGRFFRSPRGIAASVVAFIMVAGAAFLLPARDDLEANYVRLSASLDPEYPGRGREAGVDDRDEAMAYASIATAASIVGDRELAITAADWLVSDAEKGDGRVGWGLSHAWDAFQDGTVNPADTIYGITQGFAVKGLLAVYELTGDELYADTARKALDYYLSAAGEYVEDGLVFRYSDQQADRPFEVYNIGAYLAPQYRKAADLLGSSHYESVAALTIQSLAAKTQRLPSGAAFWNYGDYNPNQFNDATHAGFFLYGMSAGGAPEGLVEGVSAYLLEFETPDGHDFFHPHHLPVSYDESPQGNAWSLGAMMFALCNSGDRDSAMRLWDNGRELVVDIDGIRPKAQALLGLASCQRL
ncbi:hypothetical protein [Aliihoeflea sp. PC F10.4]